MSELHDAGSAERRVIRELIESTAPAAHRRPSSLLDAMDRLMTTLNAEPPAERLPRVRSGERDPIDPIVRRGVWLRDGGRCSWCGNADRGQMQLDHIVPWSAGGSDRSTNLRVLCAFCNDRRSNYRADMAVVRVIPVAYACSRCADLYVDESYATTLDYDADALYEPALSRPVEYLDPVAAFCARCRFAGTAERAWTL